MLSHGLPVGLVALIATSVIAAEPSPRDRLKKELDRIQGAWKVVALECDGEQSPPEIVDALRLIFKDDALAFSPGEPGFANFKYRLDPTCKPACFDMTHVDGMHKGETQKGIYSLEGDRLKICLGNAEGRPKELTAKAGSGQGLYTLERERP